MLSITGVKCNPVIDETVILQYELSLWIRF